MTKKSLLENDLLAIVSDSLELSVEDSEATGSREKKKND